MTSRGLPTSDGHHGRRAEAAPIRTVRPTARGMGVLLACLGLLALVLATGTEELLPIVVALTALMLVAPAWASVRATRANRRVVIGVEATPMVVPTGTPALLQVTLAERGAQACPSLSIEAPTNRWVRRTPEHRGTTPEPARSPSRARRVLATAFAPAPLVGLPVPTRGSTATYTSPIPTARRGVFMLPAASTWVCDPLRLCAAPGPKIPPVTVVVHPRADAHATWPIADSGAPFGASDRAGAEGRGGAGDLVGIRPYVTGDRLSLLHWPARARYGAWFVRQFAPEDGAMFRLVIDDRAGVHRRKDFEALLSSVQGLIDAAYSEDRPLELCTLSGRSTHFSGERRSYEEVIGFLASLRPRTGAQTTASSEDVVLTTVTGARTLPSSSVALAVGA